MAGDTKQTTKKAPAETGPQSTDTLVDELHAWFREYAVGDSFALLRTKLKEVDTLNEKNTRLQTAYDEAIDRFAKREARQAGEKDQQKQVLESSKKKVDDAAEVNKQLKEELAKQRAALADRAAQVNEQEARIRGMITQSKKQEAEIQSLKIAAGERDGLRDQLATMTERNKATASDLAATRQNLNFVHTHTMNLTPIQKDKEGVCRRLASLFSGAHQLMLRWFQHDIDEHILTDAEHWKGAGTDPSIRRIIPLLRPNSDVAKGMRVSASLSVLARAAAKYIMRPTYLVQDDGIDYTLAAVAGQNVEQEMYVRATLLMVLPEQQKERGRKGIQMVVKEVENAVGGWVPEKGRHGFSSELKSALERIADNWSHIQVLAENVRPHWDTTYGEDWRPLPALPSADPADATGTQAPQRGTKGRGRQAASKPEAAASNPPPAVGSIEVPIWPSFAYRGAGGEKPLYPGFGLSQSLLASAEEEVSRRTARRITREERPPTPLAIRDSSFLFAGASNGASAGPSAASDDSGSA